MVGEGLKGIEFHYFPFQFGNKRYKGIEVFFLNDTGNLIKAILGKDSCFKVFFKRLYFWNGENYFLFIETLPERNIDSCAKQINDHCLKGPMPVDHAECQDKQLGYSLQQKNCYGQVDLIRSIPLESMSSHKK